MHLASKVSRAWRLNVLWSIVSAARRAWELLRYEEGWEGMLPEHSVLNTGQDSRTGREAVPILGVHVVFEVL